MDDADEDKLVDNLRSVAWMLERRGHKQSAKTAMAAAAHIERLAAEVERLTPKPMTIEEACEILNKEEHRLGGWEVAGRWISNGNHELETIEAIGIAREYLLQYKEAHRA